MAHLSCKGICLHSNKYYGCYSSFPRDSGWQLKGCDQACFLMLMNPCDNHSSKFLSISSKRGLSARSSLGGGTACCSLWALQSLISELGKSVHTWMSCNEGHLHSSAKQGDLKGIFHLQSPQMRAPELSLAPDQLKSWKPPPYHQGSFSLILFFLLPGRKPEPHAGAGLAYNLPSSHIQRVIWLLLSPLDLWQLLLSDTQNINYTSFSRQWGADIHSTVVQSGDTGTRLPGNKPCLLNVCCFLLGTWASFYSLHFPVFIFKGGIVMVYEFQRVVERVK